MKHIDHVEYPKRLRRKTVEELRFIISDCRETIRVNPQGENVGYYLDEIAYCSQELRRR